MNSDVKLIDCQVSAYGSKQSVCCHLLECLLMGMNTDFVWDFVKAVVGPFI